MRSKVPAQACLGGDLSVSNRVDRLRFAPHLFLTRAPIGLERSDSPIAKLSGRGLYANKLCMIKIYVKTKTFKSRSVAPDPLKRLVRHFQDATSCVVFGDEPRSHEDKD